MQNADNAIALFDVLWFMVSRYFPITHFGESVSKTAEMEHHANNIIQWRVSAYEQSVDLFFNQSLHNTTKNMISLLCATMRKNFAISLLSRGIYQITLM